MAWWSSTREHLRTLVSRTAGSATDGPRGDAVPTAATGAVVQRQPAWTAVPAMPRVIAPHPLIAPLEPFTAALPTRQSPAFLAPLEHVVAPEIGGLVQGLGTAVPPAGGGGGPHPVTSSVPAASPAVQRIAGEPPLVLAEPRAAASSSGRTAQALSRPGSESLVRAQDPTPPRDLPVVARMSDPDGLQQPPVGHLGVPADEPAVPVTPVSRIEAPAAEPTRPEPIPAAEPGNRRPGSAAPSERPVVSRSAADLFPAASPALSGARSYRADETRSSPQQGMSAASQLGAVAADTRNRSDGLDVRVAAPVVPAPPIGPVPPIGTVVQRADPPAGELADHRARSLPPDSAGEPSTVPGNGASPRPTVGLGEPLIEVAPDGPVEPAPVAVGFAAFPFGTAESGPPGAPTAEAGSAAARAGDRVLSVSRHAADESLTGKPPTAADLRTGPASSTSATTIVPTPPAVAVSPASPVGSPSAGTTASAGNPLTQPMIRQRLVDVGPAMTSRGPGPRADESGTAGEAAVRAGVAQRVADGSYVFAPPPPTVSPDVTAGPSEVGADHAGPVAPISRAAAPVDPPLPLAPVARAAADDTATGPVLQRLWGSDGLTPAGLTDQVRRAVPAVPSLPSLPSLPSAPSGLPSLPGALPGALPVLPAVPALPSAPALSSLLGAGSLPSVPAAPALPGLPTLPAVPSLPDAGDALRSLPGLGSLPAVPGSPTLPTLPTLPGIPALPSVPMEPGITAPTLASLPGAAAAGVPGLPSVPDLPSMPALPSLSLPTVPGLPAAGLPSLPIPGAGSTFPAFPTLPSSPGLPSVPGLPAVPRLSSSPGPAAVPGLASGPGLPALPTLSPAPGLSGPATGPPVIAPAVDGPAPTAAGGGAPTPPADTVAVTSSSAPAAAPADAAPAAAGPGGQSAAAAGGLPAAAGAAAPGIDVDELARRLIDPISARLRTELWLDRERAGLLTDL